MGCDLFSVVVLGISAFQRCDISLFHLQSPSVQCNVASYANYFKTWVSFVDRGVYDPHHWSVSMLTQPVAACQCKYFFDT